MEINIKSLKFDADQKLIAFVEKKVSKIARFDDQATSADVVLSLLQEPENKNVKIQINVPGQALLIEKNGKTFEDAVDAAVDAMKEKVVRAKEKRHDM